MAISLVSFKDVSRRYELVDQFVPCKKEREKPGPKKCMKNGITIPEKIEQERRVIETIGIQNLIYDLIIIVKKVKPTIGSSLLKF